SAAPPPPAPAGGLLQKSNLVYLGAFRVPDGIDTNRTYSWGGTGLAYWPAHDSLVLVGNDQVQYAGEFNIPTPVNSTNIGDLPRATTLQGMVDILQGKRNTIDGNTYNGAMIGGILPLANQLLVSVWSYYDAGDITTQQKKSHFLTGQTSRISAR